MPTWGWILIAAVVVLAVVAVIVAGSRGKRRRSEGLKERFGPEYERTVAESGDPIAAEKELAAREQRREKLDIVPLTAESLGHYVKSWRAVQTAFVDDPTSAVGEADRLVTRVMSERGYPVDDFDRRAADLSVDHPTVVENYRAAHGIYLAGATDTEAQRQAFVHYRALFDKLLETHEDTDKSQEAHA
ncbi:hypothetical protein TUM20983_37750 [Mycobacterium antarcticum]|uniref:hypothetical protein n=1 Tax=Mycolicibacterium sp. TUM20983 TaxID=3023369 RepID=UPI00238CC97F|nr:hypothetical protein [Mycolicibacterium sp. TUM20983]GLP76665.1 hypothetical protein TUM20983_37750 [Mycolicibacterium sp. TUM20983]